MPTVSGGSGDDVESQEDEIKVFKYEGDEEDAEKRSSENLTEDKSSLITETEEEKIGSHVASSSYATIPKTEPCRPPDTPPFGLFGPSVWGAADRLSYFPPFPYPYTNGTSAMTAEKMGLGAGGAGSSLLSLYNNGQHFAQPPPAHMGISPYQLDPKAGLRPSVYPFTASQYSYHLGADFTAAQMASAWFSPSPLMAPHPAGLTPPLPHSLVPSPKVTDLPNTSHDNNRVPWGTTINPEIISAPGMVGEYLHADSHSFDTFWIQRHHGMILDGKSLCSPHDKSLLDSKGDKKPHIKKPLNAFMLYMKEMRAQVVAECTLKESAAINQILGRKWHALSKEEQAKYYDLARRERQVHMQLYPGWNARDNYGMMKKKKRKKEKSVDGANMKKCRARYGLDQQSQWCKPCRRKKKCIRYMEGEEGEEGGSNGSVEAPESEDSDDDIQDDLPDVLPDVNMASPSSNNFQMLLSPSTSLASPSGPPSLLPSPASLASPTTPSDLKEVFAPLQPQSHQQQMQHQLHQQQQQLLPRAPVGTNPRDLNNPLSVNQLTGQCITSTDQTQAQDPQHPAMVSVT